MLSAEIIVAPTSLNDVRTAVETRLPNAEWIRLEGSSSGPVKSLSHLLKIECSELEKLLGKPNSQKNGLKDRLGSPNVGKSLVQVHTFHSEQDLRCVSVMP